MSETAKTGENLFTDVWNMCGVNAGNVQEKCNINYDEEQELRLHELHLQMRVIMKINWYARSTGWNNSSIVRDYSKNGYQFQKLLNVAKLTILNLSLKPLTLNNSNKLG